MMVATSWLIRTRMNRKSRELETSINDKRAVSALAAIAARASMIGFDECTQKAAKSTLSRLLPTLNSDDCNQLTVQDFRNIRSLFSFNDESLKLAILDFWGTNGGKEELQLVEKSKVSREPWEIETPFGHALDSCAASIRANLEKSQSTSSLLRPIDSPVETSTSLLRPAGSSAPSEENLVRPVE